MQVINWLELQPLPADLEALHERLQAVRPLRNVYQWLVETTLRAYPWKGRADLIPCYHPSQTYKPGQRLALLISDPHNARRTVWQLGQVKHTKVAANPIQGRFQVVTVEIRGKQVQMAGGIPGAPYPEPDLSRYSAEELAWLVEWVSNTYAAALQVTLKRLIEKRQICGQLVGEIFLPDEVSALSPELLHPLFAHIAPTRPWLTLEEIYKGLPNLSQLKRETVLALLHAALKESPYQALGAGRWTTPEIFQQLDREVPLGLPTPSIRSNASIWTKRDEKELAGYDRKLMLTEARHALEELGVVEREPEPEEFPWHPPKGAVPLPALNYFHITQACLPVCEALRAFAPGIRMVFVQFINGDHRPFLLDRENGLLKAVHPEELPASILKDGIPAGTFLWLEYEGDEKYRIAPRTLPFKRMVPCKLAYLEDRRLHVQHIQIPMRYEGSPSLFKADMSCGEINAQFAEASRVNLSVRDAMIYAVKEICATDPDHRAHRLDIANAAFLQRMCSPSSISLLLYTQPCFEQLEGSNFRYKPLPDQPVRTNRKRKDRLSKLWDTLLSDAVAPNPSAEDTRTVVFRSQESYPAFPPFPPALELPSLLREPEPELSMPALPLVALEEDTAAQTARMEDKQMDVLLLRHDEPVPLPGTDAADPASHPWRDSINKLLHSLVEPADDDAPPPPAEEAPSEGEASPGESMAAAHEESLSFSSPFHWDPKPAWLDVPAPTKPPLPAPVDARHLAFKPKIPIRPLHKQPLYRRIFFYLHRWLSWRKTA
jgi:hypothetical protein